MALAGWAAAVVAVLSTAATLYLCFYLMPQPLMALLQWWYQRHNVVFYKPCGNGSGSAHSGGERPRIALTIDDSPTAVSDAILDVLRKHGVKATFFIISSYTKLYPESMQRIVDEGHEIANHMTVDEKAFRLPLWEFKQKLLDCEEALEPYRTKPPPIKWHRPGGGVCTVPMLDILNHLGYKTALANVYPNDANGPLQLQCNNGWLNSWYLRLRARPGCIIVVHDRPWTIRALDLALPYLVQRFTVGTLTDLMLDGTGVDSASRE